MNSDEKLEQSCIIKEKGTQSFKVSMFTLCADFMKEWVILHSACVYFRKVNTSRRRCSTKRSFHGWNMSPGCQTRMRRKQKRCDWLHIWTWPCASSRWRSPTRLWKTVTRYRFYWKLEPHEKNGRSKLMSSTVPSTSAVITTNVWMMVINISWSFACAFRPWSWISPVRKLCSAEGRHFSIWKSLTGPKTTSSKWFSCTPLTKLPRARYQGQTPLNYQHREGNVLYICI